MRRHLAMPAAAVALLLLAGCSGPAARVGSLSTEVALAASGGDPKVVEEVADARAGDIVTTDADGLAELTFTDGSLTRLGPDTTYEVVEVSDAAAQRTIGSLDVGSTFHRVEELVGDDSVFEVRTPFGTAAVRGTIFAVTCTSSSCEVVVLEGEVEFTPEDGEPISVLPFQRLVVPDGAEATIYPYDAVAADPWLSSQVEAEELDGLVFAAPEAAGLEGVWSFAATITASELEAVGTVEERDWTFSAPNCDAAGCIVDVQSTSGNQFPFAYDGSQLTLSRDDLVGCYNEESGELVADDAYSQTITWSLDASSAADGFITGTREIRFVLVAPELCQNARLTDTTTSADVTLERQ